MEDKKELTVLPEVDRAEDEINQSVIKFDEARRSLAKATNIEEIVEHRDKAQTFKAWAKVRGASLEVLNDAAEFKLDCERKAGRLLAGGDILAGRGRPVENSKLLTVSDLGITHNDSSRWQRISRVEEDTYQTWIAEMRAQGIEITSSGLIKLAKKLQTQSEREALAEETAKLMDEMDGDDAVIYDLDKAERLFGMVRTFYCDPPWKYDDTTIRTAAELAYPTMSIDDLCAMGPTIKKLVHKDGAFIWLWSTWPKIRDGSPKKVLDAWGFKWSGEVVWNKVRMGLGRWIRSQTEVCILGTRGSPKKMNDETLGYIEAQGSKHSVKPLGMYEVIEAFGAGEYLELFHRGRRRNGWSVFGNAEAGKERSD